MGSCYSHKAGGGKYTYSTVQMASTKLEDTSRLARPTPYCRGTATPNRKGIPISTRPELIHHGVTPNELKNARNPSPLPLQSSIPRFNSNNAPAHVKGELNENIVTMINDQNDNNALHNVNNNPTSGSGVEMILKSDAKRKVMHTATEKKVGKPNSKSCPEQISAASKVEEKPAPSRLPAKLASHATPPRSLLPHFVPRTVSHCNIEPQAELKSQLNFKSSQSKNDSKSNLSSSSQITSESHTSITDFDSGIGSSFIDKVKPEDSDTLQDVERLDFNEDPESVLAGKKSPADGKTGLKYPTYKRELNGKWTLEEHSIFEPNKNNNGLKGNELSPTKSCLMKSPESVGSFGGSGPTYASYKGLLSYKKHSSKSIPSDFSKKEVTRMKSVDSGSDIMQVSSTSQGSSKSMTESEILTSPSLSTKGSSLDSDDKSDGVGSESKSPPSEIENREFLIDDEIADQPSLISFVNGKIMDSPVLSLRQSVTELHALQSMSCSIKKSKDSHDGKVTRDRLGSDHRDSLLLSSEMGSSCSSIASDDLMLDYDKKIDFPDGTVNEGLASPMRKVQDLEQIDEQLSELQKMHAGESAEKQRKRLSRRSSGSVTGSNGLGKDEWRLRSISLPLRPPRPMSVSEADDGSIVLDSSSYRLLSQDLNGVKTLLLRLKNVIQEAETINPFDHVSTKNIFYHNLVNSDTPKTLLSEEKQAARSTPAGLTLENADLRRQLVLLQQQLEEKNRVIHLLQQQMTKYTNSAVVPYENAQCVNSATQTDRTRSLTGSLSSSLENSSETLVSAQDFSEDYLE